jgi:hypothetical protein
LTFHSHRESGFKNPKIWGSQRLKKSKFEEVEDWRNRSLKKSKFEEVKDDEVEVFETQPESATQVESRGLLTWVCPLGTHGLVYRVQPIMEVD